MFGQEFSKGEIWLLGLAVPLLLALLACWLRRSSNRVSTTENAHARNVADCLAPFNDALANIRLGEHNHIFIMKSFFRSQEDAIAIYQSKLPAKTALRLKDPWNQYKKYYELNAKGRVYAQFAAISEPELNALHNQLTKLMEVIKKT